MFVSIVCRCEFIVRSSPNELIDMGGIGGQQAFVLLFLGLMIGFHLEARRCSTHRATPWAPFLYALYVVLLLITVRLVPKAPLLPPNTHQKKKKKTC